MSKLIITGIENGKIKYIEGDEVSTSVEEIQNRVNELREKISKARSVTLADLESNHQKSLAEVSSEFEVKLKELEETRDNKIKELNLSFESEVNELSSVLAEVESLEREETKLTLILEGLKSQEVKEPDPVAEVEEEPKPVIEQEVEEIVEEKPEEEVVKVPLVTPSNADLNSQPLAQTSMPSRRIIF